MDESEIGMRITVRVSDPPFCAAGDGMANDRPAIQSAIDYVYSLGGGNVVLSSGKTYLSGGIILKSGVELIIESGAVLQQTADRDGYVKPDGDGYQKYRPEYGHNYSEKIKWSHFWYKNYPFIFAPEGSRDFAVKGGGVIRMMEVSDPDRKIKLCPIGFYRCSDFEISGVHITNYHSYAVMPFSCQGGLIKDVRIDGSNHGNGDGICLMNCQNIRVTGCEMMTGDDSVYIFSSYRDPRKSEWWSSDDPQPSENIEIDHNLLRSNHCKAFGMILWGIGCDDQEKVEVRHIYVHDNHIETLGIWLYNPYTDKSGYPPVTDVRFENNVIDGIEANFFETQISDMNHFRSTAYMLNGNFRQGRCFWSMTDKGAGVCRGTDGAEKPYGFIDFSRGVRTALYQGLYMESGRRYLFKASVRSDAPAQMFVRDLETGELIAEREFDNPGWENRYLSFSVPVSGNYHIGIEGGAESYGRACIREASFSGGYSAFGYDDVIYDDGKIIYKYSCELFRREEND